MRVLIIGCGYVGLPLGSVLAKAGHEVTGVRRSGDEDRELLDAGIRPVMLDITRPEQLAKLPGEFDWVVNCVSSSRGGAEEYRRVFLEGTRNLIERFNTRPPLKYVYTSSTSVYGQTDGSEVDESSPARPASETGRILVETEDLLLESARERQFPAVILRVAGIYGPGRGYLFFKYLAGEARIAGDGRRFINMIHRDDLVGAIIAALQRGRMGDIYNVGDDEPVTQLQFFRWLSERLGQPLPPFATDAGHAGRKRGLTHKKVLNGKLRTELAYELEYPTFREGYAREIKRLLDAGILSVQPRTG